MAASTAGPVTEQDRKDRSCLTSQIETKPCGTHAMEMPREHTQADASESRYTVLHICTSENAHKMGCRGKLCDTLHKDSHRATPTKACSSSAPRASRALQGPGRRCTNAARRANPCKTAPASCRRPGTRTGQRRGRHPTPGDPALWTRAKQKRKFGQKGRLTKEKKREGTFFYRNISGERIILYYNFI